MHSQTCVETQALQLVTDVIHLRLLGHQRIPTGSVGLPQFAHLVTFVFERALQRPNMLPFLRLNGFELTNLLRIETEALDKLLHLARTSALTALW